MSLFDFVKGSNIHKKYVPHIKNFMHKARGFNGKGKPITFSEQEEKDFKDAVIQAVQEHSLTRKTKK